MSGARADLPSASVIVRVKNEIGTLPQTIASIRRQTVPAEIVIVDSGSTDGSLEYAREAADVLVEIPPERFTYGRALNVGGAHATGDVHFALSAHCAPTREDWIERSLTHYADPRVAGTNGEVNDPDGRPLTGVLVQTEALARRRIGWGFSNHASSWRADVWQRFPFDESLGACEDKEWAFRVLCAGSVIVFDRDLYVTGHHRRTAGARAYFHRRRREARAYARFAPGARPPRVRDALKDWWTLPAGAHPIRARLSPMRVADAAGSYLGRRRGVRERIV